MNTVHCLILFFLVGVTTFALSVRSAPLGERYAAGSPKRYTFEQTTHSEFAVPKAASSKEQDTSRNVTERPMAADYMPQMDVVSEISKVLKGVNKAQDSIDSTISIGNCSMEKRAFVQALGDLLSKMFKTQNQKIDQSMWLRTSQMEAKLTNRLIGIETALHFIINGSTGIDERVRKRSAREESIQFSPDESRTEIIQPIMNIMGSGLSGFGNMYPVRQLRNDDGSPMNTTQLKSVRTEMNAFHAKFAELGQHLTDVVGQTRALKPPFQRLGKNMSLSGQLQTQNRKLKTPPA